MEKAQKKALNPHYGLLKFKYGSWYMRATLRVEYDTFSFHWVASNTAIYCHLTSVVWKQVKACLEFSIGYNPEFVSQTTQNEVFFFYNPTHYKWQIKLKYVCVKYLLKGEAKEEIKE